MILGEQKTGSIFAPEEVKIPATSGEIIHVKMDEEKPTETRKIIDKALHESAKNHDNIEIGTESRTHDLFFQNNGVSDYSDVLKAVQEHISENYSELITGDISDSKEQMKRFIGKYIFDKKIAVEGKNSDELIAEIYTEMAEYGFLTKYIFASGIEEIDSATRS